MKKKAAVPAVKQKVRIGIVGSKCCGENKVLAHPASVDSITTSGNQEDYVSMGMDRGQQAAAGRHQRNVLAIEAAVAQALDFRTPAERKRGQAAHAAIRSVSPTIREDRILTADFANVAELIASGNLAEILLIGGMHHE